MGGFVGCPDAELFAEWMELGALQPFFRNHSEKQGCRREPWVFGDKIKERSRKAVERRTQLLPYLYTLFEESSRTGAPIMRPLWFEYPKDPAVVEVASAYLLGAQLLVAPKLLAGSAKYSVVLPGGAWYDTQTSELLPAGKHELEVPANDSLRLFARAGAILALGPVLQSVGQPLKGALRLDVWPGPDCSGTLYVDDGRSFAFQSGAFRRLSFSCEPGTSTLVVESKSIGTFDPWWQELRVVLHGVPRAAKTVSDSAGANQPHSFDAAKKTVTVTLAKPATDFGIRADFGG